MSSESNTFHGCMPALMTPCTAQGAVDFDALVGKGRELIDAGMSAVIYCGSMGDWPLLEDQDRMTGVERLVAAGVPTVVGTGAQNPRRAAALAAHAGEVGAAGLMVIPRVLSRGTSPAAQRAHFEGILRAAPDTPAVIYNSPYYGFETKPICSLTCAATTPTWLASRNSVAPPPSATPPSTSPAAIQS